MIIDIELVHDTCFDCFDTVMATLLSRLGYRYELLFMNSWGFSYRDNPTRLLGNNVSAATGSILKPINLYHGINLKKHRIKADKAIAFIENEIKNNRPIIMNIDLYWCVWCKYYQKKHEEHSVIVNGIDTKNEALFCTDFSSWVTNKGSATLSFHDFYNGYFHFKTLAFGRPVSRIDWKNIIREAVLGMRSKANYQLIYILKKVSIIEDLDLSYRYLQVKNMMNNTNPFEDIRKFSYKLNMQANIVNEKLDNAPLEEYPLLKHMGEIANGRRKFAHLLTYIGKEYQNERILELKDVMTDIGWMWEQTRGNLHNAYIENTYEEIVPKLCEKVYELAGLEEKVAHELLSCAENEI